MKTNIALILSIISLALGATGYWRSGGQQDVEIARAGLDRKIEELSAKQKEISESTAQSIAAAYETSRQRLQAAREAIRQTKEEAAEGLEQQLKRVQEQLDALAQRLEEGAKSAKEATVAAARSVEQGIDLRVRRVEARTKLLHAKAKTKLAVAAAGKMDFQKAEERLDEATDLLIMARGLLDDDRVYDEQLDKMKGSLREATVAVKAKAEDVRKKLDQVLSDTDRLVGSLESDEAEAASQPK